MLDTIFKKYSCFNANTGLLALRIGIALVFIIAGYMKLADMQGTVAMFDAMAFAAFWAYVVTFVELIGGIAILLGMYTRIAAFLLAIVMIVAFFITYKNAPAMAMYPVSIFFSLVALVLAGAGSYAIMKMFSGCCGCKGAECAETCTAKKSCCDGKSESCCGATKTEETK